MQFEKIDKGETCVLILHENIEFYGGLNLKKALDEILKEKYKHIIIEMEKVIKIDSFGLGMLLTEYHTLKKEGAKLSFVKVNEKVEVLLKKLLRIDVSNFFPSIEEALQRTS
ncbi:MAG: STAS domain-containing protein [Leptospiraceae bacterium]|nr:STAS domain-containing protein [Leptospiraceae bacterium]MCP5501840.1 STAS domain-containing protein [Leptospiraceae bacterium]